MKTILSSLLILIGIYSASGQVIPNSGFESWHPYALGQYPDFWTTSDSVAVALGGGTSVFKGSDPYEGTSSIHMKSVTTTFGITGPGVATNGLVTLNGATFVFSGGTPDTARSRIFTGWYKYTPTNVNDAAVVKVYLKRDSAGTMVDVASDSVEITGTTSSYAQFILPLNYINWIAQPETCLIILQSSRALNDPNLGVGSEFVVDSLGFSGFVGINELPNNISSVKIFPLPANTELNIDVELKNNVSLSYEIYDINGRLILNSKMNSANEKIDVSSLTNGKYILKLNDEKRLSDYSTTFSIVR